MTNAAPAALSLSGLVQRGLCSSDDAEAGNKSPILSAVLNELFRADAREGEAKHLLHGLSADGLR